jgi:hypothetical protein
VLRVGERTAWFAGRLAEAASLAGARLFAIAGAGTGVTECAIDATKGEFRLGPVVPDVYRLRLCVPGRAPLDPLDTVVVRVRAGETHELGLVHFPRPSGVEVRGPGPYCLRGADGLWHGLDPVADGVWRATELAPGEYAVWSGAHAIGARAVLVPDGVTRVADPR